MRDVLAGGPSGSSRPLTFRREGAGTLSSRRASGTQPTRCSRTGWTRASTSRALRALCRERHGPRPRRMRRATSCESRDVRADEGAPVRRRHRPLPAGFEAVESCRHHRPRSRRPPGRSIGRGRDGRDVELDALVPEGRVRSHRTPRRSDPVVCHAVERRSTSSATSPAPPRRHFRTAPARGGMYELRSSAAPPRR